MHGNGLRAVGHRLQQAQARAVRHVDPRPEDGPALDGGPGEHGVGCDPHARRAGERALVAVLTDEDAVVGRAARARDRVVEDRAAGLGAEADEAVVREPVGECLMQGFREVRDRIRFYAMPTLR
ncbi:hypothetical protein OG749_40310 [Streptomyces nojiriensis]|uniref:hypothetical protein n=1 Tax=Streptomyces nojiriensis TaxID=66374 RepID=UPI002E1920D5